MKYKSKNFYYGESNDEGYTAYDIITEDYYENIDTGLIDIYGSPILS